MQITRRALIGSSLPLVAGACQQAAEQAEPGGVAGAVAASEFRTFEDFGAVGDFDVRTGRGSDDTEAIQSAIDWAYGDGVRAGRAILMTAKNFLCGEITTYPYTTIIGTGRHTSNFICKPGTTGRWWSDRGKGAQKLMLSGIAWYGRNEKRLTHVCAFGDTGTQFGTEGILQGLWMRDAPNAYGLFVNGNVGILRDITTMTCRTNLKVLGNANLLDNIVCMEAFAVGAELYGAIVNRIEVEATANNGLPIRMKGDVMIDGIVISTARGYSHSHLIEIDTATYDEWAVQNVILLGSQYTIRNGILKIGANYRGGTAPAEFSGGSYQNALNVYSGKLSLKHQLWQAFSVQIANDRGKIRHRIGSLGDPSQPASFDIRVRGASALFTDSPVGPNASTAFAAGGKVGNPGPYMFILDTGAAQVGADQSVQALIQHNNSGTALSIWARVLEQNVGGTAGGQLVFQFFDAASGAPYPLSALPVGKSITVGLTGFLA